MTAIIPLIIFAAIAFFAFSRMKGMKGSMGASVTAERDRLAREFAAQRQNDESDAAFLALGTHKLAGNRQFWAAVTNKRLLLNEINGTFQAFDRRAVDIRAEKTKWTDIGNTVTTTNHGWNVFITLPSKEKLELRLYGENAYDAGHAPALGSFLQNVGSN